MVTSINVEGTTYGIVLEDWQKTHHNVRRDDWGQFGEDGYPRETLVD